MYVFDFTVVLNSLPFLLSGVYYTIAISVASLVLGVLVGSFAAVMRLSKSRLARYASITYIEFFRDTPLLVQVMWFFFALPILLNIQISAVVAATLALGLNAGAFLAEIFRAGIQSVPVGQVEAAKALGLHRWSVFRLVVAPQALRIVLPALGNSFISLIKDSSLASVISVAELMRRADEINTRTYRPLEVYTVAAIVYFALTFATSLALSGLERRWNNGRK
ncbi:amino acid ABC transporter permease [Mesorhizobium sp.]|uniref:amino acid ABC transporter permease n=1 Tax=Mesorhizobium sp. TaxID=1871066 RepID=UPI000FE600F3|nr:amino acid ABC transporter permease [Mesorhizobium sp.]RWI88887.1 MAG: amino acid ABC transporter permease [Mesorhizobium sp.]